MSPSTAPAIAWDAGARQDADARPGLATPQILTLDLETVPDARLLARAMAEPDVDPVVIAQARAAADDGNVEAFKELLGEDFRPGNAKKPEALLKAIDTYVASGDARRQRRLAKLGMEPTTLAICSFALFTLEPGEGPDGHAGPMAMVSSWGTASNDALIDETRKMVIYRQQIVEAPKPLLEMSVDEQWAAEHRLLLALWDALGTYADGFAGDQVVLATYNGASFDVRAIEWRTMRHRAPFQGMPGVRPTVRLSTPRFQTRPHLDVMQVVTGWERHNYCKLTEALARLGLDYQKYDGMDGSAVYPAACEGRWSDIETYNVGDVVDLHQAATQLIEGGLA